MNYKDIKTTYEVPYEAGFSSGIHKFSTLEEAVKEAKSCYGKVYITTRYTIDINEADWLEKLENSFKSK